MHTEILLMYKTISKLCKDKATRNFFESGMEEHLYKLLKLKYGASNAGLWGNLVLSR